MTARYTIKLETKNTSLEPFAVERTKSAAIRRAKEIAKSYRVFAFRDVVNVCVYDLETGRELRVIPVTYETTP
jgi:hypothetical protein